MRNRSPRSRKPTPEGGYEEPVPAPVDFAIQIQPILEAHCLGCHGPKKRSGGLRLDAFSYVAAGGDSAKPILGGTLETNELYARVSSHERTYRMPKNAAPLLEEEIALDPAVGRGGGQVVGGAAEDVRSRETAVLRALAPQRRPTGGSLPRPNIPTRCLAFTRCWRFRCCCW